MNCELKIFKNTFGNLTDCCSQKFIRRKQIIATTAYLSSKAYDCEAGTGTIFGDAKLYSSVKPNKITDYFRVAEPTRFISCFGKAGKTSASFLIYEGMYTGVVYIAWRGSSVYRFAEDFIRDADPGLVRIGPEVKGRYPRVQKSTYLLFRKAREAFHKSISLYVRANRTFVFTGHSLGGALALYSAVDTRGQYGQLNILTYTYGAIAIGNQTFVDTYITGKFHLTQFVNPMDGLSRMWTMVPGETKTGTTRAFVYQSLDPNDNKVVEYQRDEKVDNLCPREIVGRSECNNQYWFRVPEGGIGISDYPAFVSSAANLRSLQISSFVAAASEFTDVLYGQDVENIKTDVAYMFTDYYALSSANPVNLFYEIGKPPKTVDQLNSLILSIGNLISCGMQETLTSYMIRNIGQSIFRGRDWIPWIYGFITPRELQTLTSRIGQTMSASYNYILRKFGVSLVEEKKDSNPFNSTVWTPRLLLYYVINHSMDNYYEKTSLAIASLASSVCCGGPQCDVPLSESEKKRIDAEAKRLEEKQKQELKTSIIAEYKIAQQLSAQIDTYVEQLAAQYNNDALRIIPFILRDRKIARFVPANLTEMVQTSLSLANMERLNKYMLILKYDKKEGFNKIVYALVSGEDTKSEAKNIEYVTMQTLLIKILEAYLEQKGFQEQRRRSRTRQKEQAKQKE